MLRALETDLCVHRRYYPKLTLDFETNKRICDEIAIIASKRLRNKVRIHTFSPSHREIE